MLEAAFWGLVTAGSLWVGAALALLRPPSRLIGLAMAFGSGALIAAVSYELVLDAFAHGRRAGGARLRCRRARLLRRRLGDKSSRRSGAKEHDGRQAARRQRERNPPRHGARRHPRVVRPRSIAPAGRRRADGRRRRRVRLERPRGAVRDDRPSAGRMDARARLRDVVRRRRPSPSSPRFSAGCSSSRWGPTAAPSRRRSPQVRSS